MTDNEFKKQMDDMAEFAYRIAKKTGNHYIICIAEITGFSRDTNKIMKLGENDMTEKQWEQLENMISQFRQIFNDFLKENTIKGG